MGKAGSEARRELADVRARLAEAEAQRARAEAAARPDATADEKLALELDTERRKNAELQATLRSREREAAIRAAARAADFVSEAQALRLIDVPEDATPEQIQNIVTEFGNKNPNLVKGSAKSGSGSGPSSGFSVTPQYRIEEIFGPKSDARLANKLSLTRPDIYKSLRAQAKSKGLVA